MSLKSPNCRLMIGWLLIAALTVLVYSRSFNVPLIFDDHGSVSGNQNITTLIPPWKCFDSEGDSTIRGRPLIGLSLAINYAISGEKVWSYHVVNLLIHLSCSVLLLLLLVRIFASQAVPPRIRRHAHELALSVVFIWSIHPLLTESVIYVVQRTEMIVAFFYLATLYCTARAWEAPDAAPRTRWMVAGVFSCALGMLSKEVMISAPLAVLIYDRLFMRREWLKPLREWRVYYASLLATSGILIGILVNAPRGSSVGFDQGIYWLDYLCTQAWVIAGYVKLSFVPWPFTILYDVPLTRHVMGAAIPGAAILLCIALTVAGLVKGRAGAMAGAVFFMVLAPSSSFVPIVTEIVGERRMYLPLAALMALVVGVLFNGYALLREKWPQIASPAAVITSATLTVVAFFAPLTYERSLDFRTDEAIWRDTMAKSPEHPLGWYLLGLLLIERGRNLEGAACLERSIAVKSQIPELYAGYAAPLSAYAILLGIIGDHERSHQMAVAALKLKPDQFRAREALAVYYLNKQNYEHAAWQADRAIENRGQSASAWAIRARALLKLARYAEAAGSFEKAVTFEPSNPMLILFLNDAVAVGAPAIQPAVPAMKLLVAKLPNRLEPKQVLGKALADVGRLPEAIEQFHDAIALAPNDVSLLQNYSTVLARAGRLPEAVRVLQQLTQVAPGDASIHARLGDAHARTGNIQEATAAWRKALELNPGEVDARLGLARAALASGDAQGALAQLLAILERDPGNLLVRNSASMQLLRLGRSADALALARQGVAGKPDSIEAGIALANLLAAAPGLDPGARAESLTLARQLDEKTAGRAPQVLDALANAQASTGDFAAACATLDRAMQAAQAAGMSQLLPAMRERLSMFQAGRPYVISVGR